MTRQAKRQAISHIEPALLYRSESIAAFFDVSHAEAKRWIRERCRHSEPFQGRLFVLGSDLIAAMAAVAKVDTEADREERRRKSGANARAARRSPRDGN
jgi:hypothetical protein